MRSFFVGFILIRVFLLLFYLFFFWNELRHFISVIEMLLSLAFLYIIKKNVRTIWVFGCHLVRVASVI